MPITWNKKLIKENKFVTKEYNEIRRRHLLLDSVSSSLLKKKFINRSQREVKWRMGES